MEIRRGDIYYIESYYSTGTEQRSGRPGIIVSNDMANKHSDTLEIVYLTTQPKKDLPTHVTIRSAARDSIALCEQVASVSIDRIGDYKGSCTTDEMMRIDTALMISLGIDIPDVKPKVVTKEVVKEVPVEVIKEVVKEVPVNVEAGSNSQLEKELAAANAKCATLQGMYDALMDRVFAGKVV